jgi:TolB-like protein/predicted negative regulator of RcsB-dependent stress response
MKIYRFRNCFLNSAERRVLKDGNYLELTTKVFDVLQLLIENRGEIVTKDEILGKVWNGSFVEEGNLAVHISKLRRLLDETKNQPFIETVQGSGYRFVAPVQEVRLDEWEKHASGVDPSLQKKHSREWTFDSIAVLPLQNESQDSEIEYLADGLTESFINSLSRLPNLKVIARNTVFRYKNETVDARQVGETLGVATVLTGRIRVIKDHLIIGIELTKTEDGTQLWGTHFNRAFTDIFKVQESIISEVLEKLKSEITNASKKYSINPITKNSESYRLYLKGKYFLDKWTFEDITKAIQYFEKSISYDPTNIDSYVEIVEGYLSLFLSDNISHANIWDKINPLLSTIAEFDQNLDKVQALYGAKKMYLDWKFEEAEKHFQNALDFNFNCSIARNRYLQLLIYLGKFSEALKELQNIMITDSLSIIVYQRVGRIFYYMNQFESALIYLEEYIEMYPTDSLTLVLLGATLTELGKYDRALEIFNYSLELQFNFETLAMIGYANACAGKIEKAFEIIQQIKSQSTDNNQQSSKLARIYLAIGEKERAYKILEHAIETHEADLIALKIDPRLRKINNELRFKQLVFKVGLPVD